MSFFPEGIVFYLVSAIVTLVVMFIAHYKQKLTYWEKKGLPTLDPVIFFGDTKKSMLGQIGFGQMWKEIYFKIQARGYKHAGIYSGPRPVYAPIDLDIIKSILQKDFQHFLNHGNFIDEKTDPLSGHLFNLEDAKWRNMRVKLTPTFTSGKMKMMFKTLVDCTAGLNNIMEEAALNKTPTDIKDILGRFTTDIIGSVAFGLECNSLRDPDTLFRIYGKKVFDVERADRIKLLLRSFVPKSLLHFINYKVTKPDVEKFFMKVVKDTVEYREKNNVIRKDFMHLLIQLKNRGKVTDDDKIIDEDSEIQEKGLTMNELAAQAFIFFIAGFETSSTTMTFALYELATNPDVQDKLRNEINTVLAKHNNEVTYEAIMEMTYMDKVLSETLRKYPPVPILIRRCTQNYIIPDTNITLEKGTGVQIPVLGIHTDPKYYPNPDVFDPERFSEESKNSRPAFTWLPFGEGPRICIGLRFGLMQSKVGLTALLRNYRIRLNKQTTTPLTMSANAFVTAAEGGVWLDIEKLE